MALSDFFRINLPYGIHRNSNNEWSAFNREYMPLGWNEINTIDTTGITESGTDKPIYTKYSKLTEKKLLEIAGSADMVNYDSEGKIYRVFLYDDGSVPSRKNPSKKDWDNYFEKIKMLSGLIATNK